MQTSDVQVQAREIQPTAVISAVLPASEIGPWLANASRTLAGVIAAHETSRSGPPFARYHRLDAGRFAGEAGFPVVTAIEVDRDVRPCYLPGGPVATTIHTGPCGEMASAFEAAMNAGVPVVPAGTREAAKPSVPSPYSPATRHPR